MTTDAREVSPLIFTPNSLSQMERLEDSLNRVVYQHPEEILPAVKADIEAFVGKAPQFDDIAMFCLTCKQPMQEED